MGNNAIIVRTVGPHQNASEHDAEQLARGLVRALQGAGHSILSATVETGGCSINVANESDPRVAPLPADAYARAAYERYCGATGGKSLVSGAELPAWTALSTEIRAAWCAAVDPLAPRFTK